MDSHGDLVFSCKAYEEKLSSTIIHCLRHRLKAHKMQVQTPSVSHTEEDFAKGFLEAVSHPVCQAVPEARWGWSTGDWLSLAMPTSLNKSRPGQSGTAGPTGTVPRASSLRRKFVLETATWSDPNPSLRISGESSRK